MSAFKPKLWLHVVAWSGAAFALVGCAAPSIATRVPAAPTVRLKIINLTDYAWSIALTPAQSPELRRHPIAPRAELEIALPPGECAIEQTIVEAAALAGGVRRLTVRFEAGQEYRWPLATLRSGWGDDTPTGAGGSR